MITCENASVVLKGNWLSIKIIGKDDTMVKAKKLYIDANSCNHKQILSYYDELVKIGSNKPYALLKCILCEKNVTGIMIKNDVLKLILDKEPIFFDKKPEVTVALYSPLIKPKKEELINEAYKNYADSRAQFLDEFAKVKDTNYFIDTKSAISSYEKENNNFYINIRGSNSSPLYYQEKEFLFSIIEELLLNCNDVCYVNYAVVTATKNSVAYYVKDVVIEADDKKIMINLIDDDEFEMLMSIIDNHNKKIQDTYLITNKRKDDNNE